MLDSIVRFADDTAGLEKALRFFQGFCTLAVGLVQSAEDVEFYVKLRAQFALGESVLCGNDHSMRLTEVEGRRYFRLLKWYPCWSNAYISINSEKQPLITALEITKWSFLGM